MFSFYLEISGKLPEQHWLGRAGGYVCGRLEEGAGPGLRPCLGTSAHGEMARAGPK